MSEWTDKHCVLHAHPLSADKTFHQDATGKYLGKCALAAPAPVIAEPPAEQAAPALKCSCFAIHSVNCVFRDARSSQYREFYPHELGRTPAARASSGTPLHETSANAVRLGEAEKWFTKHWGVIPWRTIHADPQGYVQEAAKDAAYLAELEAALAAATPAVTGACPKCGKTKLIETHHGSYCPSEYCKYGWETEMDGSPLRPLAAAVPADEGLRGALAIARMFMGHKDTCVSFSVLPNPCECGLNQAVETVRAALALREGRGKEDSK